jgi:hypothetical protein
MSKKIEQKILREDIDILCSHKVVSWKKKFFCVVYKSFSAKIDVARD